MTHKVGLPWVAGLAVLLASGTLFAAAQSEQRQGANAKDPAAQAIAVSPPNDTAAPTSAVSRPNDTGAFKLPQNRSAMPMTIGECEGLGGKVVDVPQESCPWTGKQCVTANKAGVIKRSCITMAPS